LDWRKVKPGDVIFVPAGTVHAIGAGLTICEIQENSDITYRLYDYGRPRELHIDHGAKVSYLGPHKDIAQPVSLANGRDQLLSCEYFRIERLKPNPAMSFEGSLPYYLVLVCTRGSGLLDGKPCRAGQAWFIPANSSALLVDAKDSEWIIAYKAAEPAPGIRLS
jgi:mannose-6-phosphate isomerase